jgi:hypothetical protein
MSMPRSSQSSNATGDQTAINDPLDYSSDEGTVSGDEEDEAVYAPLIPQSRSSKAVDKRRVEEILPDAMGISVSSQLVVCQPAHDMGIIVNAYHLVLICSYCNQTVSAKIMAGHMKTHKIFSFNKARLARIVGQYSIPDSQFKFKPFEYAVEGVPVGNGYICNVPSCGQAYTSKNSCRDHKHPGVNITWKVGPVQQFSLIPGHQSYYPVTPIQSNESLSDEPTATSIIQDLEQELQPYDDMVLPGSSTTDVDPFLVYSGLANWSEGKTESQIKTLVARSSPPKETSGWLARAAKGYDIYWEYIVAELSAVGGNLDVTRNHLASDM